VEETGALLSNKKKCHLYLFSDSLMLTKPEKKGKKFISIINLQIASLNTADEPGVLKILTTDGIYRLTAENPKDREHWAKILKDTINLSRTEMLTSAFGANMQAEGSKKFMKIQDDQNAQKKKAVAQQLLQSETDYVNSVSYIRNTFIVPIRKSVDSGSTMLSLSDFIDIISNLETLLSCHQTFLQCLKDRVAEWDEKPMVGDLFQEKAGFLKLYNYYVNNHHQALATIDKCIEKSQIFAFFLRDLEAREKVELKMLLQEPLRRPSAYYLLVQEMLQYTRPKTDDYDVLTQVVARLKDQTEQHDSHILGKTSEKIKTLKKSSRGFRISGGK